jgi:hypothetical protein
MILWQAVLFAVAISIILTAACVLLGVTGARLFG